MSGIEVPPLRAWPDFDPAWVLYRDDDVIVVHKPAGISCQTADPRLPDDLPLRLRRFLAAEQGKQPEQIYLGTHQRLDRDTSGLLLYTLRPSANPTIARQFEGRSVDKVYLAVVQGELAGRGEQQLDHRLVKGRDGRMHVAEDGARGGKRARTRARPVGGQGGRTLLSLHCDTGRTHQLRAQLSAMGSPIMGDVLYGGAPAQRLMLHASQLRLKLPSGDALCVDDPAPQGLSCAARGQSYVADTRDALGQAMLARYGLGHSQRGAAPTTAFRLLHREADGVPGLAIDAYGPFAVVHLFDRALDEALSSWTSALRDLGFEGVYVKRHAKQKNTLGEQQRVEAAPSQPFWGRVAPQPLVVLEYGVPFGVRLGDGLRTGLFLDQRENRARVYARAEGKRVLNLFAYTGAFSVAALAGGARSATCVDASAAVLAVAADNVRRIGAQARHQTVVADVFDHLQQLQQGAQRFDLVVIDPPSYSTTRSRRFQLKKHYVELCAAAMGVCAAGGSLLACANHGGLSQGGLRRFVHEAVRRTGRRIEQLSDVSPQRDFPVAAGGRAQAKSVWARLA